MLPATGFGPGTIIIAAVGAVLTLFGAIMRRVSRRPAA
jgi:LPXTG-motif cell wall-anchored protein